MAKKPKKSFLEKKKEKILLLAKKDKEMYVYCITCTYNGKRYIGSTSDINKRWLTHQVDLCLKKHHNYRIQEDFDFFGITKFTISILWRGVITRLALYGKEQEFIDSLNPEYNIERVVVPWRIANERLSKAEVAEIAKTS